ncbi:MAG: heparinase II/III family protein [Verrucomicrobia bacterium]|nr:heparinase II/III family protein [Verrucomicrobiota bacterium]
MRAALALAFVTFVSVALAVRDPWFPDGPVRDPIPHGELLPPKVRTPQFPLKTARTLHSDAEIAQARANLQKYPAARAVERDVLTIADYWAAWDDTALRDLVTSAEVPRSLILCEAGCPIHGKKIYEVGGSYPWIIDPKHPFKVTCPIGGESYPDNDYGAYYRSGFKDRSTLKGKYVDDGWGWVGPNGQRYWFVAHANLLQWQRIDPPNRSIIPGFTALGHAYLLTGDARYAHKAAVLLRRIAEVYPNMDFERQSDFGIRMAGEGTRYTGKILGAIWEADFGAAQFAEAYDDIWPTIDGDLALQKLYGQTGEQLRAFIEANYLEEAIDAYFDDKIRGNYGTHQHALLTLAVVRQHGDNTRYLNEVVHRADGHFLRVGMEYALNDLVFRDGAPHESPDYNFAWTRTFANSAGLLQKLGYDLTTLPRMRRLFDQSLDFVVTGTHSPAVGDSTNVFAPIIGANPLVYQQAFRLYEEPRHAVFLAGLGADGEAGFKSYDSLFSPPLAPPAHPAPPGRVLPPQASRLLSGYGYAILNNPADTRALGLYYGEHVNHYHHDRLAFDLFAHGQAMTPSLGYPDAMNDFNAGIFTWSKATISHNTVTVDARRQEANPTGTLRFFSDGPAIRAISVDAPGSYPQTTTYRRTMVMVDLPPAAGQPEQGYVVDFFDVAGGHQHDYSLHGPPGDFSLPPGVTLNRPAKGTLAGEKVALGEVYDDPVRGAKDFKGSFRYYEGSGFQHLFNVQTIKRGESLFVANYAHEKDPSARLRIRILPQPGQQLLLADAHVSPVKHPELIKYLIARRTGPADQPLESTFISVLEPYSGQPFVNSATSLPVAGLAGTRAVLVSRATDARGGTRDLILHRTEGITRVALPGAEPIETDAEVAVVTLDDANQPVRAFFTAGTYLRMGQLNLTAAAVTGEVSSVNAQKAMLGIRLDPTTPAPDPATLIGRTLRVENALHQDAFTIRSARLENGELVLETRDDLRVGLARVATASGSELTTKTPLYLAALYPGTMLTDRRFLPLGTVKTVKDGTVTLATPPPAQFPITPGDDVWFIALGFGDRITIPATVTWERK